MTEKNTNIINDMKKYKLSEKDILKVFFFINLYEYSFGIILGHFINFLLKTFISFESNSSLIVTLLVSLIVLVPLLTVILFGRTRYIHKLPFLKDIDLKNATNFSHPPPLAFTFGFWQTQQELSYRNNAMGNVIKKMIDKLIKNLIKYIKKIKKIKNI